jgi:hypothetical protein
MQHVVSTRRKIAIVGWNPLAQGGCVLVLLALCGWSVAGVIDTGGICDDFQFYGQNNQTQILGDGDSTEGVLYVQTFEPPQYPWTYDELCVSLYKPESNFTMNLDIVVYDDLGPDGGPGNLLAQEAKTNVPISANVYEYVSFSIAPQVLTSGRRYFGVSWDPVAYPDVRIGVDWNSNGVPPSTYYSYSDGETWREAQEGYGQQLFALLLRLNGAPFCERKINGSISAQSPTWNRISSVTSSLNCDAPAVDIPQDGQSYKAYAISSETGGPLVAIMETIGNPMDDAVMALYCDPFEPANPTANLIAYDDNGGEGSLAAFTSNDGLNLAPGETYWLVVTTLAAGDYGDFQICLANGYERVDPCDTELEGRFNAGRPVFDRAANTVLPLSGGTCQPSVGDGAATVAPFAVYELTVTGQEPFVAAVEPVDGGVSEPYLYLYCGFHASEPAADVIEGRPSVAGTSVARLGDSAPILLSPGMPYYLVVTAADNTTANYGDYRVCLGPGVSATPLMPPACAPGAVFGQPPYAPFEIWDHSGSGAGVLGTRYDSFFDVFEPITRVAWYATHNTMSSDPCVRNPDATRVRFYSNDGGLPGEMVYEEAFAVAAFEDSYTYDLAGTPLTLRRYELTLTTPVMLETGWVSFTGQEDSNCLTYWMHSPEGNGTSVLDVVGPTTVDYDLAFCLYTTPATHTADQDGNNIVSLSELLRVIQFYNSDSYGCQAGTEYGFAPNDVDQDCAPHASDYNPQNWAISLSELLRVIQFYNTGGYQACQEGEDRFCPGLV